jgi:hypothetical protein
MSATRRRVRDHLRVHQLRARRHGCRVRRRVAARDERGLDPEPCERPLEQRAGAAVELRGRHDVIAGLAQLRDGEELRDCPDDIATAPIPPSRLAIRSSNAATVGLLMRV